MMNNIPPFQEGYQTPPINRATQMRRDTDTVVTPSVGLYDIDYSIMYHLSQNLKLQVTENNRLIDIPVIYGDGERWMQIRARGYMRDPSNRVMAPAIVIRRNSVDADTRLPFPNMNNSVPKTKFYPYVTMNTQYDRVSQSRTPSYEYYTVDVPQYVRVSYSLIVWTHMIDQLNTVLQKISAASNHLWGDYYTFRTVADSMTMNTDNNSGGDRIVSADVSLTVDGWLRDEFKYHEPTMQKAHSIKKVEFNDDGIGDSTMLDDRLIPVRDTHISMEPKHLQMIRKRRNVRFRR